MKGNIKRIMLSEFEKRIDEIMLLSSNEENFNKIINLINYQKNCWQLCRFDLQNKGNDFNRINILENFNNLHINFPSWFRNHLGQGCQIEGSAKKIYLKFQCINDGNLRICLRGIDFRNLENLRCPVYINFTKFKVNNELIFDYDNLICHDQPFEYEIYSNDKKIFDVYLEFKTIFDYYPFFLNIFDNVKNMVDLVDEYNKFKKQVEFILFFEQFDEINNYSLEMYDFMKNDNELSLGRNEENLLSYGSFLNYYYNFLQFLEMENKISQLNTKIEFLENKMRDFESIINSNNELFNTIFLNYTLKPNKLLFNVQSLCLELLSFVNKICQKHNIKWWLDCGNLLGSIRHENFIPWDDDVDIGMMRKDYHKFIDIMFEEFDKNNVINYIDVGYRWRQYENIEINSFLQFAIRDENVGNNLILAGLDVFPYDFMGSYDSNTFGPAYNEANRRFYKILTTGSDTSKLYMGLNYSDIIDNYFQELNLTYEEDNFIITGVEGGFGYNGTNLYELIVFNYSDIFPLNESQFGEYVFPVPRDSHFYLKSIYGNDYMSIPKNIRTHNRLNDLRNIPNINNILEKKVNILKEVNNNFQ